MPSNIEIKAKVTDPDRFRRIATELSASRDTLQQEDTFFCCPHGRLKLRAFPDGRGELIFYDRPDETGPKESRYWISQTADPDSLRVTLGHALGTAGVVRKTRELFQVGRTRIHLDHVEGLGTFAELEVVMSKGETVERGRRIAADLMRKLNIAEDDLVHGAYIDLLPGHEADRTGER